MSILKSNKKAFVIGTFCLVFMVLSGAGCTTQQRMQNDEFRVTETERTTMCLGLFPVYQRETKTRSQPMQ